MSYSCRMRLPALYAILDEHHLPEDPSATVNELAEAGVTLLQLRAKQASPENVLRLAGRIRAAAPAGMTLILNDYAKLLGASGFHGLHLRQGDLNRCGQGRRARRTTSPSARSSRRRARPMRNRPSGSKVCGKLAR